MGTKSRRLLILSYYANMPGACQAEWLDDKIDSFHKLGCEVLVVSASCSGKYADQRVRQMRVPSISLHDFRDEVASIRARGGQFPYGLLGALPVILTIGAFTDLCQYFAVRGVGDGRWSWGLSSFLAALYLQLRFEPDLIVTTGGPASAHIAGCLVGRLTNTPVISELQDPLSGGDIGRNAQAVGWLSKMERFIIAMADKTVYATKAAALFAKERYGSDKIKSVYPGARDFHIRPTSKTSSESRVYRIVHLGTLYGTRNFKSICSAIDRLVSARVIAPSEIELINLGHVGKDVAEEIRHKPYVKILKLVGRREALEFAAGCDLTLLIQHSGERSKVTIPYKTYDYLNLGNNVLGLLNSAELTELLASLGHRSAAVDNVDAIEAQLSSLLAGRSAAERLKSQIDAVAQAKKLIEMPPF